MGVWQEELVRQGRALLAGPASRPLLQQAIWYRPRSVPFHHKGSLCRRQLSEERLRFLCRVGHHRPSQWSSHREGNLLPLDPGGAASQDLHQAFQHQDNQ